jgi:hypothetical protein
VNQYGEFEGIDAAWLAVDALGQVAIFTTAGEGPIPETALASVETVEKSVWSFAEVSGYELHTSAKRPDDFIAFAKRGLFAYDWSDAHRVASKCLGGYELQAQPSSPLHLAQLPALLQAPASATLLSGVKFGSRIITLGA